MMTQPVNMELKITKSGSKKSLILLIYRPEGENSPAETKLGHERGKKKLHKDHNQGLMLPIQENVC